MHDVVGSFFRVGWNWNGGLVVVALNFVKCNN